MYLFNILKDSIKYMQSNADIEEKIKHFYVSNFEKSIHQL